MAPNLAMLPLEVTLAVEEGRPIIPKKVPSTSRKPQGMEGSPVTLKGVGGDISEISKRGAAHVDKRSISKVDVHLNCHVMVVMNPIHCYGRD